MVRLIERLWLFRKNNFLLFSVLFLWAFIMKKITLNISVFTLEISIASGKPITSILNQNETCFISLKTYVFVIMCVLRGI